MRDQTRLEVYWGRLSRNWERISQLAPNAKILPMVKANAYGHGLVEVSQFLHNEMKTSALGVATLGEAEAVIKDVSGFNGSVIVFSEINLTKNASRYSGTKIQPVISSLEDLKSFLNSSFSHLPLIVKLNTGMNRLGLNEEDWEKAGELIKASPRRTINHLMSHYAYSYLELKDGDRTHRQFENFKKAQSLFVAMGISIDETSIANSGAIEQKFSVNETWVRPGLMLYGPPSFNKQGEIISSLVTTVLKVFSVKKGTPVGYGTNVTNEDGVIAVLPIGYGDGFPTQASGWKIQHNGFEAKVFGFVNMDMAFLFFPTEALGRIKVGDEIRLWDADSRVLLSYAEHLKTHAYQALCSVSSRVPRNYHLE